MMTKTLLLTDLIVMEIGDQKKFQSEMTFLIVRMIKSHSALTQMLVAKPDMDKKFPKF